MTTVPICWYGSLEAQPPRRMYRAGPLTVEYDCGDLRYLRFGDWEVVRRWYVAVRDRNWGTVSPRLSPETIASGSNHFRIAYEAENRAGDIDFAWSAAISGTEDGTVTFRMEGVARTTFQGNRIGFCLLHPIRECAGARCRYEKGDGRLEEGEFPRFVAPQNPFREIRVLRHELGHGVWAEFRFEGDLFDIEDQRNWTDASFKSFGTPLRLPVPATIEAGSTISQQITLRITGPEGGLVSGKVAPVNGEKGAQIINHSSVAARPSLAVRPVVAAALPEIGLGTNFQKPLLTPQELRRIRTLRPAHLRVDIDLSAADCWDHLRQWAMNADALGSSLESALTVSDRGEDELAKLVLELKKLRSPIRRWLIFHRKEWSTSERWCRVARKALGQFDPKIPIFSGTTANFFELNRGRPPIQFLEGVCYSIHPQEHAFDNASLVETCTSVPDTIQSARQFCGRLPIAVTPITLRKRVNPYATGPLTPVSPGSLPPTVDPRQMSLFGAGWTLANLKYLAESEVSSLTYFETVGWCGVMEAEAGSALPNHFPSQPGMVFPLFHVIADAVEHGPAEVLSATASHPLRFNGLALRSRGTIRVIVANMTSETTSVVVSGLGASADVRVLDESTFALATQSPEAFRADLGSEHKTPDGRLNLTLRPHAYARIDPH